jgi:hypothetical protein
MDLKGACVLMTVAGLAFCTAACGRKVSTPDTTPALIWDRSAEAS